MAEKHHGHRYMTSEERAHKRYGKTTKTHHAGAPPPPAAEGDGMPSGGAPPPPAVPGAAGGPSPADAVQAQAAGAMGLPQGTSGMNGNG